MHIYLYGSALSSIAVAVIVYERFKDDNPKDTPVENTYYLLDYKKNIRFDFDDELKIRDVRYKHLTKIIIKVQLFWRLSFEM